MAVKNFKPKTKKISSGSLTVFLGLCKGCSLCLIKCPTQALFLGKEIGFYNTPAPDVDSKKCNLCGICEIFCPDAALKIKRGGE